MNDDLAVLRERVPGYAAYSDERDRHDTDIRVRALLGSALTRAHARAGTMTDSGALGEFEAILMRCMFGDQKFVKRFEHADLDAAMVGSLLASDRGLVDLARRADRVSSNADLEPLVRDVERAFAERDRLLER